MGTMHISNIFKNWRVIMLIVFLLFAALALRPSPWNDGVAIRSVADNSSAALAGIHSPEPNTAPLSYERIIAIDNLKIASLEDYSDAITGIAANTTLRVITDKASYVLRTKESVKETPLNETEI